MRFAGQPAIVLLNIFEAHSEKVDRGSFIESLTVTGGRSNVNIGDLESAVTAAKHNRGLGFRGFAG
jgi:hypothetical protein